MLDNDLRFGDHVVPQASLYLHFHKLRATTRHRHMNIFRLLGDLSHLASKCILIWSIHWNKSAEGKQYWYSSQYTVHVAHHLAGISFLTQSMYALVFLTRYLDLLFTFVSLYNTIMKIFYIVSAFYVLSLRWIYPHSPESRMAWQATAIILISAALISLVFNYNFTVYEVRWLGPHTSFPRV